MDHQRSRPLLDVHPAARGVLERKRRWGSTSTKVRFRGVLRRAALTLPVYINGITGNCAHQHGTARMGEDPDRSVLNRWCRSHEVPNLYVFDGSPFPTSTGANPTLTIMANAWRCAERILTTRGSPRE